MGTQTNQAVLATSIINNAQQTINNYCSISCNNNFSNSTITVNGGNATILVSQTCSSIGSECMIKNLVSAEISNLIDNIIQQSQSNMGWLSLLGPSQSNNTNISNAIKNQISQLINNTCNQNQNNNVNAVNVIANNADAKISFIQTGNMDHVTCALDTVAKLVLNNDVQNSVKQSQSSCGNVLAILIVIGIIVLMVLIIMYVPKPKGGSGSSSGSGSSGSTVVIQQAPPPRIVPVYQAPPPRIVPSQMLTSGQYPPPSRPISNPSINTVANNSVSTSTL